jgi:hypothetical protein
VARADESSAAMEEKVMGLGRGGIGNMSAVCMGSECSSLGLAFPLTVWAGMCCTGVGGSKMSIYCSFTEKVMGPSQHATTVQCSMFE